MIVNGLEFSEGESWGPVEIPDSFVVAENKVGEGSGEAKLYVGGRDNAELRGHFGPQFFSASCVMLKEDLSSFLEAAKAEYDSPSQDFADASLLPSLWMERWEKVSELPEKIFFEIKEQAAGGDRRCYIKGDGAYDLLRELPLSRSATVTFTKLTNEEGVELQLVRLHVKHQNQKIRFWQVQHDATGSAAESLGLLWSPKKTKTGSNSKWYTNMAEVQPGDRIYSYRNGEIQAIGIAETTAVSESSPFSDDEIVEEGWLLKVKFTSMPTPFSPTENYEFLSSVMSQIDSNSVRAPGANAIIGYLKEISPGLAAAYDVLGGLSDGDFIEENGENLERFSELADELLLPASFLSEIHDLLEDKKQVIFYGPPGAGKTYVAMKLAEAMSEGSEELGSVELVQFHPSYAYEDFVEGFRPTEEGAFTLKKGKLLSIALKAKQNPETKFFLIIDEINRGNVAKIFGEMYFLLEYRDRSIQLQYSDESFQMPNNLYFIGTMNSADRSIGLIDSALRRRFHFVSFYPTEMEMKGLLRNWLKRNAPDVVWVADAVDEINSKIDRNFAVGPSHFMKSNLDDGLARKIWKRSILPYIEDVFFNQQSKVDEFKLENLRTLKRLNQDKLSAENELEEDDSAAEAS
jgi:hypothetical protein